MERLPADGSVDRIVAKGASDIGLTEETVATAVRSRLRAARLYGASGWAYLYLITYETQFQTPHGGQIRIRVADVAPYSLFGAI